MNVFFIFNIFVKKLFKLEKLWVGGWFRKHLLRSDTKQIAGIVD